jgi:hypothetical protein
MADQYTVDHVEGALRTFERENNFKTETFELLKIRRGRYRVINTHTGEYVMNLPLTTKELYSHIWFAINLNRENKGSAL